MKLAIVACIASVLLACPEKTLVVIEAQTSHVHAHVQTYSFCPGMPVVPSGTSLGKQAIATAESLRRYPRQTIARVLHEMAIPGALVAVVGTDGWRNESIETPEAVYALMREEVVSLGGYTPLVFSSIDGEREAVYAWFGANFVAGAFSMDGVRDHPVLRVEERKTSVCYRVSADIKEYPDVHEVSFLGETYFLRQKSYELGLQAGRDRLLGEAPINKVAVVKHRSRAELERVQRAHACLWKGETMIHQEYLYIGQMDSFDGCVEWIKTSLMFERAGVRELFDSAGVLAGMDAGGMVFALGKLHELLEDRITSRDAREHASTTLQLLKWQLDGICGPGYRAFMKTPLDRSFCTDAGFMYAFLMYGLELEETLLLWPLDRIGSFSAQWPLGMGMVELQSFQ